MRITPCLLLAILVLPALPAAADCTATRIGTYTFYSCSDGRSGSATQIGNTTFYQGNDGSAGSSTRLGSYEYYLDATPARSERPQESNDWGALGRRPFDDYE